MIFAEFTPKHLEKAVDMARHIATFAQLEFDPSYIRMKITDACKVVFMDMILTPTTYKCETPVTFGINLQIFYKILRSLDNELPVEIEVNGSLKINQCTNYHTLLNQEVPVACIAPTITPDSGYCVKLPTKTLQKYVRILGGIAPALEMHYVPLSDTLFLESVSSMYRTLFSIDTSHSPNQGDEEHKAKFLIKFVEMGIAPGLCDNVELTFGQQALWIHYANVELDVMVAVGVYTEA